MRRLVLLATVAGVFATARPARAAEPDAALVEAKRRYEALEYEQCLENLARVDVAAAAPAVRVDVYLQDGLCSVELNRRERAKTDFRAALRLDPGVSLPKYTSPKIVEVFDAAKAEVLAERRPAPPPTPAPVVVAQTTVEAPTTSHGPPLATWILGGVAVAAAGTGTYFGLRANGLASDARAAFYEDDVVSRSDRARSAETGANVSFAVAGVAAVAAVVVWVVSGR